MKLEEIEALSKKGESNTLEFKKSTAQLKSAGKTLCAFLNGLGGIVLIGVTDKGKVVGQEVTEPTKRLIGNTLAQISPESNIKVSYVKTDANKKIVVLEATANTSLQPYTFDSKPYIRLESNTITMPREQYQRLSVNNALNSKGWENIIVEDAAIEDFDTKEILKAIKEGLLCGRISESAKTSDPLDALKRLGLLNNGGFTNAAIVLFAKNPMRWLPQCKIRLARFKGTDKREFIDNKQIEGNIFKIKDEAMTFALRYLPISGRIVPGIDQRIDTPLFPLDALREVFLNALCHRDYSIRGETISLGIYDDRIEVWNPGTLPPDVSFKQLKNLHESKPRNPLIADTLYRCKLIETWGRGIEMIINLCVTAGHPEPKFVERTGGFCVILRSKQLIGSTVSTNINLSRLQIEILQTLSDLNYATVKEILQSLENKVTTRAIQKNLKDLEPLGLVSMEGSGKNTYWTIVKHEP